MNIRKKFEELSLKTLCTISYIYISQKAHLCFELSITALPLLVFSFVPTVGYLLNSDIYVIYLSDQFIKYFYFAIKAFHRHYHQETYQLRAEWNLPVNMSN